MALSNQQVFDYFLKTPGMSDAQILAFMRQNAVSPSQIASTFNMPIGEIVSRLGVVIPPNEAVLLGDTWVQPKYRIDGSGENQQLGPLEGISVYKTTGGVNDQVPVGTDIQNYSPTGEFVNTTKTQKVDNLVKEFLLGSAGLFGGAALAGFGGTGAGTVGVTGANGAFLGEGALSGITASDTALANAANTGSTGLLTNTAGSTLANTAGSTVANTAGSTVANTAGSTLANTAGSTLANTAATTLTATELANAAKLGLTAAQYAQLFSSTAQTASGLLQQQTSKEAADKARTMIDAETAAAKAAAQFRPIGMTTRFGSSQFGIDPLTGRLTSAGYTLSPEAKAAQDRFVKLAETGIQQAEGAQQAFKPLQTGAESLFKLGAGYLAEKPEDVAKNYLASQMALLKPGRELELANLQNRLQQQGRGGLSVAQGGTMGATTPELQALYNARAQQEAVLAANAQQAGQQQVAFGAGLLGTGAQTMGQYYAGQQGAYAPYTTAMGQITGLEALGQQPFTMSTGLGQQVSQAGANVGQLGLRGAEQSVALATGRAATTNPYATLLGGVGSSDALGQVVGGMFSGVPATTAMSAPATTFGTGNYYGRQDLGLFL
jgi:hypothetical protein